ncbi:MAG TPA: flagellar cap protein FliD N-terminal domain-containing protein, partial [Aggregatilineales bacterium]|nr:flagellar cap protein FliD N-terminal domain-containing protein [Aggregatilineales bacterium]
MSTTPAPIFTGASKYASDLQQVITRAVGIASFPLNQLNAAKTTLETQVNALSDLGNKFSALQTAISNLASVAGTGALSPTVSEPSVLSAQATAGALAGTYKIHVVDPGSPTDAISNDGLPTVTDPSSQSISTASSFTLTVGGTPVTITPSSNSLNALAQAINTSGAKVNATVVNIGSNSSPDYRLALE